MGMVKVFWFGSEPLRSPRTGIRPRNFVKYDERIATELVRQFGDLIMISTTEDKITHLGSSVNPAEVIHFFPVFKTQLEKMVARKIVPSLPTPAKRKTEPIIREPREIVNRQPPLKVSSVPEHVLKAERMARVKEPPKHRVDRGTEPDFFELMINLSKVMSGPAPEHTAILNPAQEPAVQIEAPQPQPEKKKRGRKKKSETEQVDQTE